MNTNYEAELLQKIETLILKDFDLQLKEVSDLLGLSQGTILSLIKRHKGVTYKKYKVLLKLSEL